MTNEFDFSNDQWAQVASTPFLVGLAVAKAEDSGFIGSHKETRTLLSTIESRVEGNAASTLIAQAATTDVSEQYEGYRTALPEALSDAAVDACVRLAAVLAEVAEPAEADGFKEWVLDVAWTVAEAAKEHGQRVSPGEAAILARINEALGLPPRNP